ncbi:BGTF surface domain-containing protein, partial [Halolamina salina]
MTDNSDKIRSIVLAALMVFSVFAGTVAFAGTAAAGTTDTTNSSITPSTVDESTTNTHTVTLIASGVNTSGNGNQVFAVDLPDSLDTSSSGVTNFNVNSGNVTYSGTFNVNSTTDVVTVTLQDSSGVNSDTVNVTFDITNVATPAVSGNTTAQAQFALDENANGSYTDNNDDGFSDFQSLTIVDTGTSNQNASVVNGSIIYQGQQVKAIGFASGQDVILSTGTASDPGTFQNRYTANSFGNVTFGTSNLQTGQNYFLQGNNGNGDTAGFQVVKHQFSVDLEDSEIGNAGGTTTTTATFDSNRQSFSTYVSAENLSAEEVQNILDDGFTTTTLRDLNNDGTNDAVEVTVDRSTEYTLNASGIDAGDYTLEFDVTDTTTTISTNISVTDVGAGEASFTDSSFTVDQGDVAAINISLDGAATGTSGTLVIGLEDSEGYQANVTFDDGNTDGQVVVEFNTYAAGSANNGTVVEAAAQKDSVTFNATTNQTTIDDILAQGDYTLSVSTSDNAADTVDQPQDLGALAIGPRSTDSMQLWTAPSGADLNADGESGITESDLATLIDDGVITQDDTITSGDLVVHQISATGLEGLVQAEGNLSAAIGNGTTLTITQTNPVQNQKAKKVDLSASSGALTFVEGDGAYYIVANTGNLVLQDSSKNIVAGDKFKATFTVTDNRLLGSSDTEDHQSVNATFTVEAPSTELDADPVEVAADSGQTVTGTTNYAPGTELTIRVRSTSDVSPGFF